MKKHLARWLEEDLGRGDITTLFTVPADQRATGRVLAQGDGVMSGGDAARAVFRLLDSTAEVTHLDEGKRFREGDRLLLVHAGARAVLSGERLALNLLSRLCGVAALTAQFVEAVSGTRVKVYDTRKTTPGLRGLEKAAVRAGGGNNHRMGLSDALLIKTSHIIAAGGVREAINRAKGALLEIEVEVRNSAELQIALEESVDAVMLDNWTPDDIPGAVGLIKGRAVVEVSGGVTLKNVKRYALPGVDRVSVGALTHSAPPVPMRMEFVTAPG